MKKNIYLIIIYSIFFVNILHPSTKSLSTFSLPNSSELVVISLISILDIINITEPSSNHLVNARESTESLLKSKKLHIDDFNLQKNTLQKSIGHAKEDIKELLKIHNKLSYQSRDFLDEQLKFIKESEDILEFLMQIDQVIHQNLMHQN